jgi:hypothetical protein
VKNLDQSAITFDVNDSVVIKVKNSAGTYIPIFGGDISDIDVKVQTGEPAITEDVTITALGALAKLPKSLTEGVLNKDFDGDQIYSILSTLLFNQWNEVPAALEWANYDATTTWANAENAGLGEIDRPGDYELTARSASTTDVYSLVSNLARSGLGYIYEDAASIATYGVQAQNILTTLENGADAESQAEFYLDIRAYPQYQFKAITFPMTNPNIPDASRDQALNIFMGLPLDIEDLPLNIADGRYQGFVEGWTWTSRFNALDLTVIVSPVAFSLQAFRWNNVPIGESWNTISPTLDWNNATIVA